MCWWICFTLPWRIHADLNHRAQLDRHVDVCVCSSYRRPIRGRNALILSPAQVSHSPETVFIRAVARGGSWVSRTPRARVPLWSLGPARYSRMYFTLFLTPRGDGKFLCRCQIQLYWLRVKSGMNTETSNPVNRPWSRHSSFKDNLIIGRHLSEPPHMERLATALFIQHWFDSIEVKAAVLALMKWLWKPWMSALWCLAAAGRHICVLPYLAWCQQSHLGNWICPCYFHILRCRSWV